MSEILADLVVKLTYRVERDLLPGPEGPYWAPWSKTDYGTRATALAVRDRIIANFKIDPDHLRVVRITVEVVG